MPASTLDPVNAALRTSLTKNDADSSLDSQLAGSTKKALLSNPEFEPAGSYHNTVLEKLKSKYIILKSAETPKASKPEEDTGADETLKVAKCELYPLEAVQLGWKNNDWSVGAGMVNMGNTCYLNSTLQALFHVPALANWLLSDKEHALECQDLGVSCIICAMRKTLLDSQRNSNSIRPLLIYNKLRLVCRNLIPGRQEDAHEFLRYLVEAMEKAYLSRFKNHTEFDSRTKETTPLNQILGGYLRSAVRCLECGHVSTTFQHFQDLLLDIRKAQTLDEALEGYFSREKLDDESYHCESCRKKVQATKQFSLERAPMVLCIQLKRFSVTNNKITKHIMFRQRLDLTRYVRHRPSVPLVYRLVALVTHMGPTVGCGHYTAVAQVPSGNFYQFDDSMVRPISHQAVFNTNAYIMLYELESPPFSPKSSTITSKMKTQSTSVIEPEQCTSTSVKPTVNGLTSSKPYGPELPPDRILNGAVSSTVHNGNGKLPRSSSSSDGSDSENDTSSKVQKENRPTITVKPPVSSVNDFKPKLPLTLVVKQKTALPSPEKQKLPLLSLPEKPKSLFPLPDLQKSPLTTKSPNCTSSNESQVSSSVSCIPLSSNKESPKKPKESSTSFSQHMAKLVPYETGDSTNSDDSSHFGKEVESRVSTKAASGGEWQVTSSSDLTHEPTSSESKSWEKKKTQSTIGELFKMSHSGYSAPVSTWNGTRSQLDKEVMNERREERKRPYMDNCDQGRAKHPKMSNNYKSNPGYNPIQEYHNSKNNWNQNNGGHYKQFYNTGNRHGRNFHHKNYHKNNYRCRQ